MARDQSCLHKKQNFSLVILDTPREAGRDCSLPKVSIKGSSALRESICHVLPVSCSPLGQSSFHGDPTSPILLGCTVWLLQQQMGKPDPTPYRVMLRLSPKVVGVSPTWPWMVGWYSPAEPVTKETQRQVGLRGFEVVPKR